MIYEPLTKNSICVKSDLFESSVLKHATSSLIYEDDMFYKIPESEMDELAEAVRTVTNFLDGAPIIGSSVQDFVKGTADLSEIFYSLGVIARESSKQEDLNLAMPMLDLLDIVCKNSYLSTGNICRNDYGGHRSR